MSLTTVNAAAATPIKKVARLTPPVLGKPPDLYARHTEPLASGTHRTAHPRAVKLRQEAIIGRSADRGRFLAPLMPPRSGKLGNVGRERRRHDGAIRVVGDQSHRVRPGHADEAGVVSSDDLPPENAEYRHLIRKRRR